MVGKHFFKPLLPGFYDHLTIPIAFLLNIKGRNEQKTVELRSDASKITWKVKIHGEKLTDGWKEFAVAHDLRIGDILVFRQETDMAFHVTMLGPSCCEIQYVSCLEECSEGNEVAMLTTEEESDEERSQFVTLTPTRYNLSSSRLHLPKPFAEATGIRLAKDISFLDKHGVKWPTSLRFEKESKRVRLVGGWKEFCNANHVKIGESVLLNLIWEADKTSVLKFCSKVMP